MLDLLVLQLDREGIKGRDDGETSGGGAIIRGTAIIQGNTVSYYPLPLGLFRDNLQHWLGDFARLVTVQFTSNDAPYQRGGGGDAPDFK